MTESHFGWSPDGVCHVVTAQVSAGLRWTVIHPTTRAACGARCLPQPTTWPRVVTEFRRCPTCAEILAERSASPVAQEHAPDAAERGAALGQNVEELLGCIWACEMDWELDDRIARAIRYGR